MSERVKGLEKLLAKLENIPKHLEEDVEGLLEVNAKEIERNAKRLAPVDTGKLFQSIKAIKIDNKNWLIKANSTGLAPYAPWVEFGTSRQRAQPFLYPAFFKQEKIFIQDIEDLIDSELKE